MNLIHWMVAVNCKSSHHHSHTTVDSMGSVPVPYNVRRLYCHDDLQSHKVGNSPDDSALG